MGIWNKLFGTGNSDRPFGMPTDNMVEFLEHPHLLRLPRGAMVVRPRKVTILLADKSHTGGLEIEVTINRDIHLFDPAARAVSPNVPNLDPFMVTEHAGGASSMDAEEKRQAGIQFLVSCQRKINLLVANECPPRQNTTVRINGEATDYDLVSITIEDPFAGTAVHR